MIYVWIIGICFVILLFLKVILGVNVKQIKELAKNQELDNLTNLFPENIQIARSMLKMLDNTNVKIEEEKESKTCLYLISSNKIIIANIADTYTRIQTIAHECLHSVQDKKLLWTQYLISNCYLFYFVIIIALSIFHVIVNPLIYILILAIIGMIQYIIKSILEMDAMIKAKYLAKQYLKENNIGNKEERKKLIQAYDELNKPGIPAVNYTLIRSVIIKIMIYSFIALF